MPIQNVGHSSEEPESVLHLSCFYHFLLLLPLSTTSASFYYLFLVPLVSSSLPSPSGLFLVLSSSAYFTKLTYPDHFIAYALGNVNIATFHNEINGLSDFFLASTNEKSKQTLNIYILSDLPGVIKQNQAIEV